MKVKNDKLSKVNKIITSDDITKKIWSLLFGKDKILACDIETTGLNPKEDEIKTIQLYDKLNDIVVIYKNENDVIPPYFYSILYNNPLIFQHAKFDLSFLLEKWSIDKFLNQKNKEKVYCTKIASKILHPNKEKHGLNTLLNRHLSVKIEDKIDYNDDFSWFPLTEDKIEYIINDVLFLHNLLDKLLLKMSRKDRKKYYNCLNHLPCRVKLELNYGDVFNYD